MKFKSIPARIDLGMVDDLRRTGATRSLKKLSPCKPHEMTIPKMSNLARRCPSWKKVLEELNTLPEKEW